uniref:Uncharacterized protein n=1 Tax=Cuerna arida TaxID=1464854 RepID=A0A1B6F5A2_9HEMI
MVQYYVHVYNTISNAFFPFKLTVIVCFVFHVAVPIKNGGYTALHLAMQYGHEDIFNLLKDVYGANPTIRDWSGRKPHQYLTNKDTSVSADTFRSEYNNGSVNSLTEWYRQNFGTWQRRAVVVAPPTIVVTNPDPATLPRLNKRKQPKIRKTAIGLFT